MRAIPNGELAILEPEEGRKLMDKRTKEALLGSITKWRAIVDGTGMDYGSGNCPLCAMFYYQQYIRQQCIGCPVRDRTRKRHCEGSPYIEWLVAKRITGSPLGPPGDDPGIEAVRAAARAELDFLVSLLPEGNEP